MPGAAKKTIMTKRRKSTVSEMTITEFNQIVDEVEKRFDPKFELIDNKFVLLDNKIDNKFELLDNKIDNKFALLSKDVAHLTIGFKLIRNLIISMFITLLGALFVAMIKFLITT